MILTLTRDRLTATATLGMLDIDGVLRAYTLELPVRDGLPGSAIPDGEYDVRLYPSNHLHAVVPLIVGIPNRSEIEIHWGNFVSNTDGCILIGSTRDIEQETLAQSVVKFNELFPLIEQAIQSSEGCKIVVKTLQGV